MDDSDQDFVDLCSKLLKRVRKKPGEPSQPRRAEQQPSSQASDGDKRKRNKKRDGDYGSKGVGAQPVGTGAGAEQHGLCGGTGSDSGDAGSSGVPRAERAKDKVLQRMQQFKRASPQRMVHKDKSQTTSHEIPSTSLPPPLEQRQGEMTGCSRHRLLVLYREERKWIQMWLSLHRNCFSCFMMSRTAMISQSFCWSKENESPIILISYHVFSCNLWQ